MTKEDVERARALVLARAARPPKPHQLDGVGRLYSGPFGGFALFDEMGVGKTKQAVDAAQLRYALGEIDTVVVLAPASVRPIWLDPDPDLGELVKDRWPSVEQRTREYHTKATNLEWTQGLQWVVTNYEFIRKPDRLTELLRALRGRRFVVIADEGGALKNSRSAQHEAAMLLRNQAGCRGAWLLNGTPVDNTPLDLYGQGAFVAGFPERMFGLRSYFHYRARYAILGGWEGKQILGYQNLETLREQWKPWCVRRLSKDVLDLSDPIDLPPLQVPLTTKTWRLYKSMRDEAAAFLSGTDGRFSLAPSGGVKVVRLSQLTGGFLGGLEPGPGVLPFGEDDDPPEVGIATVDPPTIEEVGAEKQTALLEWAAAAFDPTHARLVVWCRFRAEAFRLAAAFRAAGWEPFLVVGGQDRAERRAALAAFSFADRDAPGRRVLVGQEQAGGLGLSLVGASVTVYYSVGYSLRYHLQTRKRTHRPPQDRVCKYMDILATGPDGQRTIDHVVRKALGKKDDVATWTAAAWRKALADSTTEAHF